MKADFLAVASITKWMKKPYEQDRYEHLHCLYPRTSLSPQYQEPIRSVGALAIAVAHNGLVRWTVVSSIPTKGIRVHRKGTGSAIQLLAKYDHGLLYKFLPNRRIEK